MSRLIETQSTANVAIPSYSENSNEATLTTTKSTNLFTNNDTTRATHQQQKQTPQSSAMAEATEATRMQTVLISLCSGAAAGALAKTTIAPLDRAKIHFQIKKDMPYNLKSALHFIRETYTDKGLYALWRGNSATMARIIPYAAIHFTAHEQWRKILRVDKDGKDTKLRRFIAGSLAGITGQSLTYPLDLARARMAVTDHREYATLRSVFVHIWTNEGAHAFFRGYWPTVIGVAPYAGCSFFTYETLKREYTIITGETKTPTLVSLAFGATAGAMGQTASYPLDIVRRRMQTMKIHKGDKEPSVISLLIRIYKDEGIRGGFYKGVSMNWIKGPIAVGISFSTYDYVQNVVRSILNLKPSRHA